MHSYMSPAPRSYTAQNPSAPCTGRPQDSRASAGVRVTPVTPQPRGHAFHSDHNLLHTQKEGNGVLRATRDQEPCLPF